MIDTVSLLLETTVGANFSASFIHCLVGPAVIRIDGVDVISFYLGWFLNYNEKDERNFISRFYLL